MRITDSHVYLDLGLGRTELLEIERNGDQVVLTPVQADHDDFRTAFENDIKEGDDSSGHLVGDVALLRLFSGTRLHRDLDMDRIEEREKVRASNLVTTANGEDEQTQ